MTTWYPQTRQPNSRGFYGYGDVSALQNAFFTPSDLFLDVTSRALPMPTSLEPGAFVDPNSYTLLGKGALDRAFPAVSSEARIPTGPAAKKKSPVPLYVAVAGVALAAYFISRRK